MNWFSHPSFSYSRLYTQIVSSLIFTIITSHLFIFIIMTKTIYLSGLKYINCELTRVYDKRELVCLLLLWTTLKPTFQTKTRTMWINDTRRSNHLGLQSPWHPRDSTTRDSTTRDSPNLHQTNSMSHGNLLHLLVTHWQQSCSKSNHRTEYDNPDYHRCYPPCSTYQSFDLQTHSFLSRCYSVSQ